MPAHSFSLVPAVYLLLLRPAPGARDRASPSPGDRVPSGSARTEVLLQRRRNTGYMDGHWACGVAGHVEPGESVLRTAVREAREEAGVVIDPEDLRALTAMHRSNDVGGAALEQRVDFFFTVRRWAGEPSAIETERNAGLGWFALADPPSPAPPHERAVLRLLAAHLDGGAPVPAITTFGFAAGEAIDLYGTARPH